MPDWFPNLTIIGLLFDIIGVVLITFGVFWKSTKSIENKTSTF
jgi:hypothetical protein